MVACDSSEHQETRAEMLQSAGTFFASCNFPDYDFCVNFFSQENISGVDPATFCVIPAEETGTNTEKVGTYSERVSCSLSNSRGSCFFLDRSYQNQPITQEAIVYRDARTSITWQDGCKNSGGTFTEQ